MEEFSKLPNCFPESSKLRRASTLEELLVPNALSSPFSRFRIAKAPGPIRVPGARSHAGLPLGLERAKK